MSGARVIHHTGVTARHPWPDDCYVHGGERSPRVNAFGQIVRVFFVEALPRHPLPTYLWGEGPSIEAAEDDAWALFGRYQSCPHPAFEPRQWRNGSGFCVECGLWFPAVLPAEEVDIAAPLPARVTSGDPSIWPDGADQR